MPKLIIDIPASLDKGDKMLVETAVNRFSEIIINHDGITRAKEDGKFIIEWNKRVEDTIAETEKKLRTLLLGEVCEFFPNNIDVVALVDKNILYSSN